jgi:hypothetical protein
VHYVLRLERLLKNVAGGLALDLAKQPIASSVSLASSTQEQTSNTEPEPQQRVVTRREERKKMTLAKYRNWQEKYLFLQKEHPNRSDVWYSLRISRMVIGEGSSAETIRKQMKRK